MEIKMYRGVDSFDDSLSMFAVVCGTDQVAVCQAFEGDDHWMTPESFGDPLRWSYVSKERFPHLISCIENAELIWQK